MRADYKEDDCSFAPCLRMLSERSQTDMYIVEQELVREHRAVKLAINKLRCSGMEQNLKGIVSLDALCKANPDIAKDPQSSLFFELGKMIPIEPNARLMKVIKRFIDPCDAPHPAMDADSPLVQNLIDFIRTYDPVDVTVAGKIVWIPKLELSPFRDACESLVEICLLVPELAKMIYENGTVQSVLDRFQLDDSFADSELAVLMERSDYPADTIYGERIHDLMSTAGCLYFYLLSLVQVGKELGTNPDVQTIISAAGDAILECLRFDSEYLHHETLYVIEFALCNMDIETGMEMFGQDEYIELFIEFAKSRIDFVWIKRLNAVDHKQIEMGEMKPEEIGRAHV